MTPIASTTSGNWNAPSTWTTGAVPGIGDTVTIGLTHTVTVTVNQTVGASTGAATTAAITGRRGGAG